MESPEVVNFPPPRSLTQSQLLYNRQHIIDLLSKGKLGDHFHGVTAVLPGVGIDSELSDEGLNDSYYYKVNQLPLHCLLEPVFFQTFVKQGKLIAQSIDTWEVDQSVVLNSDGTLKLSVDKDLYQELGLIGQPELKLCRQSAKYIVTIPLLDKGFSVESKFFKRVLWCLKNHQLELQFNWIMKWKPHNEETCPSSLAAYLDFRGYSVIQCKTQFEKRQMLNVLVPQLNGKQGSTEICDLLEWSAAAALNIQCSGSFASSLTCPKPNSRVKEVTVLKWRGFLTREDVESLIVRLTNHHQSLSWLNINLHSFDESCISGVSLCSLLWKDSIGYHLLTSQNSPSTIVK